MKWLDRHHLQEMYCQRRRQHMKWTTTLEDRNSYLLMPPPDTFASSPFPCRTLHNSQAEGFLPLRCGSHGISPAPKWPGHWAKKAGTPDLSVRGALLPPPQLILHPQKAAEKMGTFQCFTVALHRRKKLCDDSTWSQLSLLSSRYTQSTPPSSTVTSTKPFLNLLFVIFPCHPPRTKYALCPVFPFCILSIT